MKTVTEHIRHHLLARAGVINTPSLSELQETEWSRSFEMYMRNRLIIGALRYGCLHASGKLKYDRITSIIKRVTEYKKTGNLEHLVDIANLALLEFEEGEHPKRHFTGIDDGEHTEILRTVCKNTCGGLWSRRHR